MQLKRFLLIGFVIPVTCTPVPSTGLQSVPDTHDAIKAVKAGVIVSASMAGIIGASIGLTEYLTNVYHRWAKNKMERETKDSDNALSRERKLTETTFQNTGTDVVLSLVERYLEKQRKKEAEVMVDTKLVEPEVEQARVADDEIDPSPPMPRLPGYPPLSETAQRYDVQDSD
jgi:hypothetical protein